MSNEIKMRPTDNDRVTQLNVENKRRNAALDVRQTVRAGADPRDERVGHSKQAVEDAIWRYGLLIVVDGKLVEPAKPAPVQHSPAVQKFDQFISDAIASPDPAVRDFGRLLTQCTATDDWLTDGIEEEITKPLGEAPTITALNLHNKERAAKDGFWLFTGWSSDVIAAQAWMNYLGVDVAIKANGTEGRYLLFCPLFVTGEITIICEQTERERRNAETTAA